MQKSSSFSDSRVGKNRPNDLLAPRNAPTEAQPWRSPSFDVNKDIGTSIKAHVSADPGRPSTQARSIVSRDAFPPTPLTATYKPLDLPAEEKERIRLPGIRDLLANTPSESQGLRTVPLPADEHDDHRFYSQSHSFSQDAAQTAALRNMPQSEQIQGLGLDLGEATPRLGDMEWSSMRTPTLSQQPPRMPGAPQLASAQEGRWPSTLTSPIQPPLRRWNTDLRFDDRAPYVPYTRPPMAPRSVSEAGPSSASAVAMERERAIELEDGMPHSHKLWGLAMSMDNGESYRRGNYLYRPDGKIIGPTSMVRSATGPQPMPAPISLAGPPTPARRQATMPNSASKALPSASKAKSTGLTPHIHKTRLTPSFSTRTKNNGNGSPTSGGVESPSLKMKSKQRSEQLRNQAANVAAQANLPSEHASVLGPVNAVQERCSPTHAGVAHSSNVPQSPLERTAHAAYDVAPSPRKRSLEIRREDAMVIDVSSANTGKPASSPWGVFELGSQDNTWQPLGPPALSNVLGKLNLDEACGDDDDDDDDAQFAKAHAAKAKRARKTPLGSGGNSQNASPAIGAINRRSTSPFVKQRGTSTPRSRASSGSGTGGEEKENDVFGSTMLGGNASRSSVSPNKQASSQTQQQQQQRRLLSIR